MVQNFEVVILDISYEMEGSNGPVDKSFDSVPEGLRFEYVLRRCVCTCSIEFLFKV